jgi:hypothetical protein
VSWLAHVLGLDPGYWNMFWSGFGSCLSEFAILGGGVAAYKRYTCHVDHPRFCWRPGVHPVAGTPFKTCRRHHPAIPDRITAAHIAEAHAEQGERSTES